MTDKQMINEVRLEEVRKCWPSRAVLWARKPKEGSRTNGSFAIQVICNPAMKDKEAEYCMESTRQILPIKEFYTQTTGSDIWIYFHYNKNLPVTFII